jgi:hypothetical protein
LPETNRSLENIMDFQRHLENCFRLLREHPLLLLAGGLLVQVLTALTLGILAGPLVAGFMLMLIGYFRDGRRPELNDLFSGLQRFLQLFPFFFLILLIAFGYALFLIPGVIFTTWWLYTLPLMADRRLSLGHAMRTSRRKVSERGFFMHLVFLFMITIIPSLMINIVATVIHPLEILQLFLFPLQCALLISLYLEQFAPGTPASVLPPSSEGSTPPPPPPEEPEEPDVRRGLD